MDKTALLEFSSRCYELIQQWKKDNWYQPLNIDKGNIVDFIKTNGGDDVMNLYDAIWEDGPDDDPEVQQALQELEDTLNELNQQKD